MRRLALIAFLTLPRLAGAFGGSSETWLDGTRPWDTVPYLEANLGFQAHGGQGPTSLGPSVDMGLHDQLMLSGSWDQPADGSQGRGEAMLTLREGSFPRWRPALAVTLRSRFLPSGTEWRPGLVAAIEPWDLSLVGNVEAVDGRAALRFAAWTPYLVSFFRAGMETCSSSDLSAAWALTPQATFQFPGDLSLVLGAQTSTQASAPWAWLARISYQAFPSP